MKFLLDTNTCINFLNGTSEIVKEKILSYNPLEICLCSIVKAELYYGLYKSKYKEKNILRINKFIEKFDSLVFDDKASKIYGEVRAKLELQGTPIGPNDLLPQLQLQTILL